MRFRSVALLALLVSFAAGESRADTIPKTRTDLLDDCAEGNLLCRHLRTAFSSALSFPRNDGIAIWRSPIRYVTVGLSEFGDEILDDLIESFATRAGLKVERVTVERAREANLTFLVTPNLAEAFESKRAGGVLGNALSDEERAEAAANWKSGFRIIRKEYSPSAQRYVIWHCYTGLHPDSLKQRPGLRIAAQLYGCLTGTKKSDFIQPSLLNEREPVQLDAPPHAKMTSLDRALLELMYVKDSPVGDTGPASLAVSRLERRLREQGFGDDGLLKR